MFEKKKPNKIRNSILNMLSLIIVFVALFSYFTKNYAINRSASIPTGIYKLLPIDEIKKGDTLIFNAEPEVVNFLLKRGYLSKYTKGFIKKVGAIEGDTVEINDNLIINGIVVKEKLPKYDSLGRELPLKKGTYTLKKDEYFMLGDHIKSFDSSYMGVIKKDQIKNKAKLEIEF